MQRNCRIRCDSSWFFLECQTCETNSKNGGMGPRKGARRGEQEVTMQE